MNLLKKNDGNSLVTWADLKPWLKRLGIGSVIGGIVPATATEGQTIIRDATGTEWVADSTIEVYMGDGDPYLDVYFDANIVTIDADFVVKYDQEIESGDLTITSGDLDILAGTLNVDYAIVLVGDMTVTDGDIDFSDTATGGGTAFKPPAYSQSAQPSLGAGKFGIWTDTDDGKVYLLVNDKKVEVT